MIYYLPYWPNLDGIECCGFILEVDDLHPREDGGQFDLTQADADLRAGTAHLPDQPWVFDDADLLVNGLRVDAVVIPVSASSPPGFTYAELRAAADTYRAEHNLGCSALLRDGDGFPTTCCGKSVENAGRCGVHGRKIQ